MKQVLFIVTAFYLLTPVCALGENNMIQSLIEAKDFLKGAGFTVMHEKDISSLARNADGRAGLNDVAVRLEKILHRILNKKWLPDDTTKTRLLPIRGQENESDIFINRYKVDSYQVELVVDENRLTIIITSQEDRKLLGEEKDIRSVHDEWIERVLNVPKADKQHAVSLKKEAKMWLVERSLRDTNNAEKQRYIAESWSESLKVALGKDGSWIAVSLDYHLPRIASGMPAGGRGRVSGSWFDLELNSNKTGK
ncbi:MAG: hypothetical protein D3921_08455 [Candidatus Electrothrix sp. AW1]|nr:hypothetical protein [Candidatus Electrothrix sp. AX1]MCI5182534.1 hypothetical protein [Candidatus Electrothrix gigas]